MFEAVRMQCDQREIIARNLKVRLDEKSMLSAVLPSHIAGNLPPAPPFMVRYVMSAIIVQWENKCFSLSVLSVARVITAQWENECFSVSVLSVDWAMITRWEIVSCCHLRGPGPISCCAWRNISREFLWQIALCQPALSRRKNISRDFSLADYTPPTSPNAAENGPISPQ